MYVREKQVRPPPASRAAASGRGVVMAPDPGLKGSETDGGCIAETGQQVIGSLGIVDGAWNGLKAEKADGLLMQLVHCGTAELAGRNEQRGGSEAHGRGLL